MTQEIQTVLNSPYHSHWLKNAINELLEKDPIDACFDARILFELFDQRVDKILETEEI